MILQLKKIITILKIRHIAQVNVPIVSGKEFSIVIEAEVYDSGYDYYYYYNDGDTAIDDYTMKDTPCQPMGDCNFEEDTCKFSDIHQLKIKHAGTSYLNKNKLD